MRYKLIISNLFLHSCWYEYNDVCILSGDQFLFYHETRTSNRHGNDSHGIGSNSYASNSILLTFILRSSGTVKKI